MKMAGGALFPEIVATASTTSASVANSHAANLPGGITAGEILLLVCYQLANPGAGPVPSGWTRIAASGLYRLSAYCKVATGGEGATVTVANGSGITDCFTAITARIKRATMAAGLATAEGGTGPPDPPSLTPGWGTTNTLWVACGYAERSASADIQITGYPAGFDLSQVYAQTNGPSLIKQRLAICAMEDAVSSKNPAAYSSSPTSGGPTFVAATLAFS